MNKKTFAESVLLEVNGGSLSDDGAVRYEDVIAFLPLAVNYAMFKSYNINLQVEHSRDISGLFIGSFYNLEIVRPDGRNPYVTLPKGTIALPRNQGIRRIIDGCGSSFTPLSEADQRTVDYYKNLLPSEKFFILRPKTIELPNINPVMTTLPQIDMVVRVEDLDDTDELPLSAGVEIDAMEQCINKFNRQRRNPADAKVDAVDVNSVNQP